MFPAPPPPHMHSKAWPANAPVHKGALGMEAEMFLKGHTELWLAPKRLYQDFGPTR